PSVPSTTGSSTERPAAESVSTTCLLSDTGVLLRNRFSSYSVRDAGRAASRHRRPSAEAYGAALRRCRWPPRTHGDHRQERHYRIPGSTAELPRRSCLPPIRRLAEHITSAKNVRAKEKPANTKVSRLPDTAWPVPGLATGRSPTGWLTCRSGDGTCRRDRW